VLLDSNGESQSAQELMESLEAPCSQFAQIAHNLGVFAGRSGNWDEAQSHFERSIQGNSRAAMSLDHLRQIHRFRASQAWREALGTSLDPSANAPVPDLALQDSTVTNNDAKLARHDASELHQLSTIEYELFDWWQSARIGNRIGWMAHYTRGFAPQDPATIAAFDWDELRHTIALVQNEAVVVMMYPVHASHKPPLFAMPAPTVLQQSNVAASVLESRSLGALENQTVNAAESRASEQLKPITDKLDLDQQSVRIVHDLLMGNIEEASLNARNLVKRYPDFALVWSNCCLRLVVA